MAAAGRLPRLLNTLAALFIVLAGLKIASSILLPLLFAVFLSIMTLPWVAKLKSLGIPSVGAILFVVAICFSALVGASYLLVTSLGQLIEELPRYQQPLQDLVRDLSTQAQAYGVSTEEIQVSDYLNPGYLVGLVGQTVNVLVQSIAYILIVTITMSFILLEAAEVSRKLSIAFGAETADKALVGALANGGGQVQRYLVIKTLVSLTTGALAAVWCILLGVDFPILWGIVAFILNYIPSVGSILASIPPVTLSLILFGPQTALAMAGGYLAINVSLGNILEPRLLGKSLGLSPLIVFLSLLFWGWMWGPVGMLFSVPMTVIAKIALDNYEDTQWLGVLLGPVEVRKNKQDEGRSPEPSPTA